jgi:adenosylhomocysteine nucleosidase
VPGPVAILSAIPQELALLKSSIEGGLEAPPGVAGILDGHRVVLVRAGIGKVNAAVTATLVIEQFRPRILVFTGVAGRLDPGLGVGDVVVAGCTIQHDAGVIEDERVLTHQAGHLPFFNPSDRLGYRPSPALLDRVRSRLASLDLQPVEAAGGHRPRVVVGTVLTGDQFVACERTRDRLHTEFDAQAVEMEGGAVAQVAELLGTDHLVIRALSDLAGARSDLDFDRFLPQVAANSAKVVRHLLPVL